MTPLPAWALERARELTPFCPHPVTSYSCPMSWNSCARTKTCDMRDDIAAALIEADRRGAKRMRERAAKIAEAHAAAMSAELPNSAYTTGGVHVATSVAYDIRALPLDEESGS